jgi:hypothetical protein
MLQPLVLLDGAWIGQMYARVAGIHQTIYQPIPIVRGLDHYTSQSTTKRFQRLSNKVKLIGNTLLEDAIELLVQNSNVSVA